ncbi:DUF3887 domain-containing protein [Antrihabitans cavernicola]|uniref:DUF3887 domain-containing protein n=1 Tax=Antrihabitans cavernicola TaxID=2495913 RepID=A0A5A7SFN7_9NOCA|nr:DUF3887 domain-containing protein [Spelaeibacter cavernicola]KAA0024948.1 DUF3887 domain-containing protein [Spelaeibacter cavernicola]
MGEDEHTQADVDGARQAGVSWEEIGASLGISRQAAFQRFGRPIDPRSGTPMDKSTLPDAQARTFAIIDHYGSADWGSIRARFDDRMSAGLSAETLADNWASVIGAVGSLEGSGTAFVRRRGDYTVVDVPMSFEAGERTLRVSYDAVGKVAGLFILKPEFGEKA